MSIKTFKPTTPSRRHMTVSGFDGIDKHAKPEASLTEVLKKNAGRNSYGRITVRHRGGGEKRKYRIIDFKRDKVDMEATVLRLEYDPNRSANIALVQYEDGEKRYIIAPVGLTAGDKVLSSASADIKPGNCLPIANIPVGTVIHNVEMHPGKGAQLVRSAGAYAQLMAKDGDNAQIRMPSGEVRIIRTNCTACIGHRTDDGVHSLPEHIKGHAQRDIEEILLGVVVGLGIDRSAEHGKNGVRKNQIERGQHNAADQTHHHRIADAPLCLGDFVLPKADADEGAAAVTDHDCDCQRYHRQGEHDGVGGVAIRAKIAGVCNKDLIHDVVQRTHQQRNNARDRVFLHQLADALRAKELIGTFHGIHLYLSILGQTKTTGSPHATGFTHECYSLYEIIIACPPGICKGSFAQDLYWAFCADCTRQTLWKMPFEASRPVVVQYNKEQKYAGRSVFVLLPYKETRKIPCHGFRRERW